MINTILVAALEHLRPGAEYNLRGDEIEWTDTSQGKPSEDELNQAVALMTVLDQRKAAYSALGDQLDSITKVLKHLKEQDIDIGPDGEAQVAMSEAVKAEYPKP